MDIILNNPIVKVVTSSTVGVMMSAINHASNYNDCVEKFDTKLSCGIATGVGVATDIGLKIAGSLIMASGVVASVADPEVGGIIAASGGCVVYKSTELANDIAEKAMGILQ